MHELRLRLLVYRLRFTVYSIGMYVDTVHELCNTLHTFYYVNIISVLMNYYQEIVRNYNNLLGTLEHVSLVL